MCSMGGDLAISRSPVLPSPLRWENMPRPSNQPAVSSPPPSHEDLLDATIGFWKAGTEQEEAIFDAVEASIGGVLDLIRDRQIDLISLDQSAAIATEDIQKLHSTVNIRCDQGEIQTPLSAIGNTRGSQDGACVDSVLDPAEQLEDIAGTLRPSPEPQPAMIDRWARGWVVSRGPAVQEWERQNTSDDGSEGGRSVRSTKSVCATNSRYARLRQSRKEEKPAVPFPLDPDTRENQGLPPTAKAHGRTQRGVNNRGSRFDGTDDGAGNSTGNGLRGLAGDEGEDLETRVKELGGREWTIDGSGKLLVVDRPKGDAMPKTVVNALYNFRDVTNPGMKDVATTEGSGRGGRKGTSQRGERAGSSHSRQRTSSSSGSRRASRRGSSRRQLGKKWARESFFALEPTLQPNLTTSLDRPGPGVSVCDGSSIKEGPTWPQDPDHMSKSEYQQRQRTAEISAAHSVGSGYDDDLSTLGFSLGSVQSAPALGELGLGLDDERSGAPRTLRRVNASSRAGTVGCGAGHGSSFASFNNINPFEGGVRMTSSASASRRAGDGDSGSHRTGSLSPLSSTVSQGAFIAAGPESTGGEEEEEADPHLSLMKDPEWGHNVRGSPKQAGLLPKVKQLSRERPLTHERPHTHNPRDPRKVPARAHLHVSPKRTLKPNGNQGAGDWGEDVVGSSSFPYLPLSLTGGGVPRGGGTTNPGGVGMVGGVRGQSPGIITMAKPMEILMEGHLRS